MKIIYLLLVASALSAIEITNIIQTMDKLNSSDKISSSLDYDVYDPFATAKPILKTKNIEVKELSTSTPIVIQTILNDRVFISGEWYNAGDKIRDFKIKDIKSDRIELVKNRTIKVITIDAIESILKMKGVDR